MIDPPSLTEVIVLDALRETTSAARRAHSIATEEITARPGATSERRMLVELSQLDDIVAALSSTIQSSLSMVAP